MGFVLTEPYYLSRGKYNEMKKHLSHLLKCLLPAAVLLAMASQVFAASEGTAPVGPGQTLVISAEGEQTVLDTAELVEEHDSNPIRWQNQYQNARVLSIGTVSEIKMDEFVVLEDESYTPKAVIHTEDGALISVSSNNSVLAELGKGDTIMCTGVITGFLKYSKGFALINTNGNGTAVRKYDEQGGDFAEDLYIMICEYSADNKYKDAVKWTDAFKEMFPDDAKRIDELQVLADKMMGNCYEGTFIRKYDNAFLNTVTDVQELSIEDYGEGYDYYDSNLAADLKTYLSYLVNQGFADQGLAKGTVNGTEDTYEKLTNADNVIIGMAQGEEGYARVIVYAPEAVLARQNNTASEASADEAPADETAGEENAGAENAGTVYTDKDTIQKVQEALNAAGYECGTPDGIAGSKTYAALNQYQTDHGLTVTNDITGELLDSFGIAH